MGLTVTGNEAEGLGDVHGSIKRRDSIGGSQEVLGVGDAVRKCWKLHLRKVPD